MRRIGGLLLVLLPALILYGCSQDDSSNPLSPDGGLEQVKAEGATAGNNLSFPVIWSDGFALPLRGTFGESMWLGAYDELAGQTWYRQQDAFNEWQAESADGQLDPVCVSWVDWGDNLEARSWPARSKVRVEVVLFKDLATPMVGYEMLHIEGQGIEEMWGTNTQTYESMQATVYTHNARLTIQKLAVAPDQANLSWDRVAGQWVGDVDGVPFYNSTVWESGEGPGDGYSAEINIQGKVIFGMLWDVPEMGDGPGHYRLTYSLDGLNGVVDLNTYFDMYTQILEPAEEEEAMMDKAEPTGGLTHIDVLNNLSYIDVVIVQGGGGGGEGNGNPHNGNGGGGGGQH